MTEVRKIKASELQELIAKKGRSFMGVITDQQAAVLEASNYAYSILVEGKVIACAGISEYWTGRGEAWAVIDPHSRKNFLAVHNTIKRFLEICPVRRIEASIEVGFEEGHRWAKALGFKLEAQRLEGFLPNGKAASLYSRVNLCQ